MWAARVQRSGGIDAQRRKLGCSLFYIGITIGRFICGFRYHEAERSEYDSSGQFFIAVGAVLMLLPFGDSPSLSA